MTSSILHYAILSGNLSTLRLLLFSGAPVAYPSEQLNKPSALDFAILRGDYSMVRLLIEFGAQLNTGSSVIGLPLHVALSEKVI
jgi:ankyrin repeat protein